MKLAILGLGGRGNIYAYYTKHFGSDIVAVCDPDISKKALALSYGVEEKNFFTDEEAFFAQGKIADALVIATMDQLHYRQTIRALELGYDILLEKPVATTLEDCIGIEAKAKEVGRKVVVCHVLRYAPLFMAVKDVIDSGVLGGIINFSLIENIGYYHFAHSFVRGNWRNKATSAPLILAKNCHDLDLLCWIIGKDCLSVSSFGSLNEFTCKKAPKGAADHCCNCKYKNSCQYSAHLIYNNAEYEKIAGLAKHGRLGETKEQINASLADKNNVYGRCVYHCDNDVNDHQIVNLLFEDGVTAQLKSIAFSEKLTREFEINCEKGVLYKKENGDLCYQIFGQDEIKVDVQELKGGYGHHGGGDIGIVKSFIDYIENGVRSKNVTDISVSVLSHRIAFLAEKSSVNGGKTFNL